MQAQHSNDNLELQKINIIKKKIGKGWTQTIKTNFLEIICLSCKIWKYNKKQKK
jgi:hypothetical protein